MASSSPPFLVDVHTHMYPPAYLSLLSSRTSVPYVHHPTTGSPRLIILPSDDDPSLPPSSRGRPIDSSYSSVVAKIAFMRAHSICTSVISLANPWLDWLPPSSAAATARAINDDMEALCAAHPGQLFHFATLPLSAPTDEIAAEVARLKTLPHCRGLIMGTSGLGRGAGLDDSALDSVWSAIEDAELMVFVHPHYGLPGEVFGPKAADSGHVLPLALGFPLETTIAFVRMYVSGVFERHPRLKLLLAHAGGAVPFLAGRVESCVLHERAFRNDQGRQRERKDIWQVLRENVWLDGVVYSDLGVSAAMQAVGKDRVMWGTDHPFFPPIGEEEGSEEWASVSMNIEAAKKAFGDDEQEARGVLGGNAVKVLGLKSVEA
jgi:aminocarboxymuconate-semialdehyde decarboxylase